MHAPAHGTPMLPKHNSPTSSNPSAHSQPLTPSMHRNTDATPPSKYTTTSRNKHTQPSLTTHHAFHTWTRSSTQTPSSRKTSSTAHYNASNSSTLPVPMPPAERLVADAYTNSHQYNLLQRRASTRHTPNQQHTNSPLASTTSQTKDSHTASSNCYPTAYAVSVTKNTHNPPVRRSERPYSTDAKSYQPT